ncbi:hypothetical protein BEP19_16745 [Ammoniphilus oxalaticus]|uniref:Uncharacterized protein n=1 Tax=Ammoniphilus oxalaticus TaxID=66863 RepID=A0A419SQ13_9BACL|nr:hypothetical protein BEP19_16745 [Ammoniphilus oxalaticus]
MGFFFSTILFSILFFISCVVMAMRLRDRKDDGIIGRTIISSMLLGSLIFCLLGFIGNVI